MAIFGGALRDRQFRRFFGAAFFAVQSTWIQRVSLGWLAWERTGSAGAVGLVAGLSLLPTLMSGPVFGVMVDRVDILKAGLVVNGLMFATLVALALAAPGISIIGLCLGALVIGAILAAHHPLRMSLGPRIVAQEMVQHVVAASALNFNLARLVAPVFAGWLIAVAGAGVALWLAALCYLPMLAVLPRLRVRALPPRPAASPLQDLIEGLAHAWRTPLIRTALILTFVFATTARGALEVLPVLADGGFGRGAAGLGLLTSAAGAGALAAAVLKALGLAAAGARIPRSVWVLAVLGQVGVLAMGLAPLWPLALMATAITGFCATWCGVSLQAALQSDLPDALRGRIMSLWVLVGFGTVALGAFGIGALAEWTGIGVALIWAGALGGGALLLIWGVQPRPIRST